MESQPQYHDLPPSANEYATYRVTDGVGDGIELDHLLHVIGGVRLLPRIATIDIIRHWANLPLLHDLLESLCQYTIN